jgi:hypothetical protein
MLEAVREGLASSFPTRAVTGSDLSMSLLQAVNHLLSPLNQDPERSVSLGVCEVTQKLVAVYSKFTTGPDPLTGRHPLASLLRYLSKKDVVMSE